MKPKTDVKKISDIDKNFNVASKTAKEGIKFYNALSAPFKIYGVYMEDGRFRRLPEHVAEKVNRQVHFLHANTAGGRVRFKTDSSYVAISVKTDKVGVAPHFALTGIASFDLYTSDKKGYDYIGTFVPPYGMTDGYESIMEFETGKMRDITINFPLYCDVLELYIGLDENARVEEGNSYINEKPVVYYGSSITQGGCASRPGNSYQAVVSRRLNCDYINLGFSDGAKAEDEIVDYIKKFDMSLFVMDYDYNAGNGEYLAKTHEKMFAKIRKENPDLPIIILSRPKYDNCTKAEEERIKIVEATYKSALASGDKKVYYIDSKTLMALCKSEGTVDNCHPNDFGFASMAEALINVIENILRG